MNLRSVAVAAGLLACVVPGVAAHASATTTAAHSKPLTLKVSAFHAPCGKKTVVGTFAITGLKHGKYTVTAQETALGAYLYHHAKAKKSHVRLKHASLAYLSPTVEPSPSGLIDVYVVQGKRQSNVVAEQINACKK